MAGREERRKSLNIDESSAPRPKRRRTVFDSVANWLLPSWANDTGAKEDAPGTSRQDNSSSGNNNHVVNSQCDKKVQERPRRQTEKASDNKGMMTRVGASDDIEYHSDGTDSSTSGCSSLSMATPTPGVLSLGTERGERNRREDVNQLGARATNRPLCRTDKTDGPKTREVSVSVDPTSIAADTSMTGFNNFSLFSKPSRNVLHSTLNNTLPASFSDPNRSLSSSLQKPELSLNRSLFYEGKTTYGGAANYRKLNLFAPSPYLSAPSATRKLQYQKVKEKASSAKKLIQALERMDTPVQNAKKIPTPWPRSSQSSSGSADASLRRKEALETIAALRQNGPPSLNTCGTAMMPKARIGKNVLPIFDRGQSDAYSVPELNSDVVVNNPPDLSMITSTPRATLGETAAKAGGKVRSAKAPSLHQSRKAAPEEEAAPPSPDLPNQPLPIKSLPSFSFGLKPSAVSQPPALPVLSSSNSSLDSGLKCSSVRSPLTSLADFSNKPFEKAPTTCESSEFSLRLPVELEKNQRDGVVVASKDIAFSIRDPVVMSKEASDVKAMPALMVNSNPCNLKRKPQLDNGNTFGMKSTPQLMKGSVMDVLNDEGPGDEKKGPSLWGPQFKRNTKAWDCPTCLVTNQEHIEKCIACETKKPMAGLTCETCSAAIKSTEGGCPNCAKRKESGKVETGSLPSATASMIGDKFKAPSGSWSCSTCLVTSNAEATKCPCCESAKPGSVRMSTATTIAGGLTFKMTPGWDCDVCLLRNTAETTTCIACTAAKPGSSSVVSSGSNVTAPFKFGVPNPEKSAPPSLSNAIPFGQTQNDETKPSSFKFGVTSGERTDVPSAGDNRGIFGLQLATTAASTMDSSSPAIASASMFGAMSTTSSSISHTVAADAKFSGFKFAAPNPPAASFSAASSPSMSTPSMSTLIKDSGMQKVTAASSLGQTTDKSSATASGFSFGSTVSPASRLAATTLPFAAATPISAHAAPSSSFVPLSSMSSTSSLFSSPMTSSAVFGSSTTVTTSTSTQPTSQLMLGKPTVAPTTTPVSTVPPTMSLFTFGSTSPTTQPTATTDVASSGTTGNPPFVFGSNSAASSGFPFGASSVPSSASSLTPSTTFSFGQNQPSGTADGFFSAAPATTTATVPIFSKTATPAFGATGSAAVFQFGSTAAAPSPASSAPSAAIASDLTAPFSFGASSSNSANPSSSPAHSMFQFGPPQTAPPVGNLFQFGQNPAAPVAPSAPNELFRFGNAAAPQTTPAASTFQFGVASPPIANSYQFPGASQPNPFSSGGADNPFNAISGRKMKKAVRRKPQGR